MFCKWNLMLNSYWQDGDEAQTVCCCKLRVEDVQCLSENKLKVTNQSWMWNKCVYTKWNLLVFYVLRLSFPVKILPVFNTQLMLMFLLARQSDNFILVRCYLILYFSVFFFCWLKQFDSIFFWSRKIKNW